MVYFLETGMTGEGGWFSPRWFLCSNLGSKHKSPYDVRDSLEAL